MDFNMIAISEILKKGEKNFWENISDSPLNIQSMVVVVVSFAVTATSASLRIETQKS